MDILINVREGAFIQDSRALGFQGWYGFEKCWKVMEINNAIFQDLESFGKGRFFSMTLELWKSFGFLFQKTMEYPKMDIT